MGNLTKRLLLAAAAGLAIGLTAPTAFAQESYPDRPITMLVGYGAGGQTDLVARAASTVMSDELGVPINVVNKPGAGGAVAARELMRAEPDGYTVLFQANSVVNSAPFVMDRITFTPDDFEYAGMITAYQTALATQKDAPFDNLAEFVAWAKDNPGFRYGALSPEARMYMEEIAEVEGLDVNIVPLNSGSEMLNALLGRQVVLALSGGIHYRHPDELKSVATLTSFRHQSAPDVETIDEQGYPLAMDSRATLFLPKGTPRPILETLNAALKAAETDETFGKVVAAADIPIMFFDVDATYDEMRRTYDRNKGIFESAGVEPR
ncbi:tripartite tricarboxylate transporter substrate binding protein [Acuticoccus sp.]|uniref:tripartite tricarboxylate transporter substrate binding protein n=1 Tax=Acuticoccus sp. TaxID=1904378 RepID=UPI003B51C01A